MSRDPLDRLRTLDREIRQIEYASAVIDWDQQTYMPAGSAEDRAEQLSLLEGIAHKLNTAPEIGELLADLGATDLQPGGGTNLTAMESAFVRETHKRYRRLTKLPETLVTELARERSLAQITWVQAKEGNRFSDFAPSLRKVLELVRQTAECLGYEDHIYDALLDLYEPEMKTAEITDVFGGLGDRLAALVARIVDAPPVRDEFLTREFPVQGQELFSREVLDDIGFDFARGRLDVSAHPFTTSLGRHDIRLTTRYELRWFVSSLFGSIHEGGHGMYEQGFGDEIAGTVLGDAASLGIHESQSRWWENIVGRSLPFWQRFYPRLSELFPEQLQDVTIDEFYRGINRVTPSFIRVEADEVTYSLHVILRFELEKALVSGDLSVDDLPEAWNSRMKELFGIVPENDADGVLQDVHWSAGLVGYFPTYALGNLYGAQFASHLRDQIPDLDSYVNRGEFSVLLDWQRENIHSVGKIYGAGELCRRSTGDRLSSDHFLKYLTSKYEEIYGL